MSVKDLIPQSWARNLPWWRDRDTSFRDAPPPAQWREEPRDPFVTFHREVNRLFDDFFRSFDTRLPGFSGIGGGLTGWPGATWPSVEISETAVRST